MPNWCCTNYALKGSKKDIKRFCDTVNSVIDKPDVVKNGWNSKFWLGNLCVAFGYQYREDLDGLRGVLDPNPWAPACLCLSFDEPRPLEPEETEDGSYLIAFSITHAWSRSKWFEQMLEEQFPKVEVGYRSTDEFGNFRKAKRTDFFRVPSYEIECSAKDCFDEFYGFDPPTVGKVADKLTKLTGITFTVEQLINWEEVEDILCNYNDQHEDEEVFLYRWDED